MNSSKIAKYLIFLVMLVTIPVGCAPPVTYVVDLEYAPELKEELTSKPSQIQVAVIPFEDVREDKTIIGTRRRLMGRVDKFDARPSPAATAVTQAAVNAFKIRGYQTEILKKGANTEGIKQSPPHIVVSGKIEEMSADAQSKLGYTDIKTVIRLKIKVYKVDDKSSFTINVQSQSEPRVVFFNPSVMQKAVNDTLTDAIDHLITNQIK
ncbi:MAG: hypothetical protein HZB32_03095 [Nitrospirae bacterium]|nr:hypothetical protein [Nitrospirota bacterium]